MTGPLFSADKLATAALCECDFPVLGQLRLMTARQHRGCQITYRKSLKIPNLGCMGMSKCDILRKCDILQPFDFISSG